MPLLAEPPILRAEYERVRCGVPRLDLLLVVGLHFEDNHGPFLAYSRQHSTKAQSADPRAIGRPLAQTRVTVFIPSRAQVLTIYSIW